MTEPILELKEVTKGFPGVVAMDKVSIAFRAGEGPRGPSARMAPARAR